MHGFIIFSNFSFLQILTIFTNNLNFHNVKLPVPISWHKATWVFIPNISKSVLSKFGVYITFLSENIKIFPDFLLFSKKSVKKYGLHKKLISLKNSYMEKEKYQVVGN